MSGPKILVATDFSPASKAALDLAASVARDRKGSILVVHVKEIVSPFTTDHLYPYQAASEEDLEKQLEEFAPDDSTIPITRLLLRGADPADTICELAEQEGAELIVLGTHGRRGIIRLLMGSVAELVVRRASCSVLVVKQPQPAS